MTFSLSSVSGRARPARAGRRALLIATSVALVSGVMLPAAGSATAAPKPSTAGERPGPEARDYDITLVTGDVVHWTDGAGDQDTVTVDRPHGAEGGVHVQQAGEDVYVIPDEASALVAAGKLDRRLFNVSTLVEMGYDDERAGGIPLIATYPASKARSLPAAPRGSKTVRRLESVHGAALKADKDEARAFWSDISRTDKSRSLDNGIAKLWLDGKVEAALKDSVPQVNAPQAWAAGYDGKGTTVAVLDTGIDATHPDVKDRITQSRSFVPGEEVDDKNGHGTHVASTVAGSGAASEGAAKGVAPGADLIIGKVLSDGGSGADSGIIEAMEWAKAEGADVVSMSLGSSIPDDGNDPMAQAVDALSADGGPLFVIAAGNAYGAGTIGSPGSAASALTVAAVDKQDGRAGFSSMGPLARSHGLKPDLSAPGVDIEAAASQSVPGIEGMYQSMSGTSMATPHVAGAAAILKQRHPEWSGRRIKDALMSSSVRLPGYTPYEQGTGRLDVKAAIDTTIEATGSVEVASYDWPHSDADPVTERTITYRNTGASDVSLDLATDTDAAAYTLSTSKLTVPAGSTAEAVLSIDPAKVPVDTQFSGQVVATDAAGTNVAHTGFAVHKEQELYDLTLQLRDRAGEPADGTVVLAALGDPNLSLVNLSGETTLRLPPGNYTAWSALDVDGDRADSQGLAFLMAPEIVLEKPVTVSLDASEARKVTVRTPQETEQRQMRLDMARTAPNGVVQREAFTLPISYDQLWVSPTEKVEEGDFSYLTRWRQGEKAIDVSAGGRDVPVTAQIGSPVAEDSHRKLGAVFAGNGAASDYKGLNAKGRAVVVERSDAVAPADRLANALAAGASALFVVNDGRGVLMESSYVPYGEETTIPVASVQRLAGASLIEAARKGTRIDVAQRKFARYVYDLVDRHDGAVPDRSLAYAPPARQLAKVENTFYGHRDVLGGGYRYDIPDYGFGIGFEEYEKFPGTRSEWVDPLPGDSFWYENHSVLNADASDTAHEMRSGDLDYSAGRTYRADWFAPVTSPRLGTGYWGPFRTSNNDVQFNITPWTDSGEGHSGSMPADEYDTTSFAFYQGDTLIKKGVGRAGYAWDLSAEKAPYRLVVDSARDEATWKTSTRTHTEWNFVSGALPEGTERADIPLLQLDYDVSTDLAGDVRAGQQVEVGIESGTQDWLDGAVKATRASLSVSYDEGATWSAVQLRKGVSGEWTVKLRTPAKGAASVSLKAHAEGPGGLSVDQEIIRAFGLK